MKQVESLARPLQRRVPMQHSPYGSRSSALVSCVSSILGQYWKALILAKRRTQILTQPYAPVNRDLERVNNNMIHLIVT